MADSPRRDTVLIVEDDAALRLLIHATIESPDYEVVEGRDGVEAWSLIKERMPQLVVLDVHMPRRSGIEVLADIRADPELRGMQVMMLTSDADQASIDAGILAGADFYVTKPFAPKDLAARVSEATSQWLASGRAPRTQPQEMPRRDLPGASASNGAASSPAESEILSAHTDPKAILGKALAERVTDVSRMTAEAAVSAGLNELTTNRFAKPIRHVHHLATRGIAKLLITGLPSTEKERNFIGRLGVIAAQYGLPVATLTRSYQLWRDSNLRVLEEETARLRTDPVIADEARALIRSAADTGIIRMARAYDHQLDVMARREELVGIALHDSETRLKAAVVAITEKSDQVSAAMLEISEKNVQLMSVNRVQSEFITNVSHELRTPLAGILGYAELLLGGTDGELDANQRRDVQEVQAGGQVLLRLVNDILDESQIEAGKVVLKKGRVDLKATVDSVLSTLRTLADQKALYLKADIADGIEALADEGRVKQIVTNLVANAIKFTEVGGITIQCQCMPETSFWRLSVEDTGIGLSQESRELIFQRFVRIDSSTTRRSGGAGLGLSIARGLVHMHGGEMGVESTMGEGSKFWFTVPRFAPPSPAR